MSAASLYASTVAALDGFRAPSTDQDALRHTVLAFLAARSDACLRACTPGHVTASALVLDADATHVLLTLHPRVGRWIQLGGHCEPSDESLVDAGLREACEESGLDELVIDPEVLHLDTHPITCSGGVPTRHLDVRFLVRAAPGAQIVRSEESVDLRWWPVDALPGTAARDTIGELVRLGLERVARTA
ncbi:NUDIX domain-containing protein [Rhodococcus antarcticus]|uniref:NUDIX domain-containing protein n=1 Tax=Rhodococcus antarcticus TaxID=2987751 RepID=A0ABY6P2T9_9NOCA|nr:NUDIX domain-containing protein [Rhodococcus antarcticus]UZJ25543.1 NUDIX domain-containing protein [Rhodococcus antarcticus]